MAMKALSIGAVILSLCLIPTLSVSSPQNASKAEKEATFIYKTRCLLCHGADGKGQGPAAVTLKKRPADFTSTEFQKKISDQQIKDIVVKGGAGVKKSPLMPPNPDLKKKAQTLSELIKIVRGFAKKEKK